MPYRVMCNVLDEMRATVTTLNIFTLYQNKRILSSLIEECQIMGNRMEAALALRGEIHCQESSLRALKQERSALKKEIDELKNVITSVTQQPIKKEGPPRFPWENDDE